MTVAVAPSVKEPQPAAPVASVARVVPQRRLSRRGPARPNPKDSPRRLNHWWRRLRCRTCSSSGCTASWCRRARVRRSRRRSSRRSSAATSVSSFIKNTYNAVEPWVQWGFEVVAYAVGWIPYVGWLAPQIMYFYNLGERIVRSITFNIADWIGGQVSFVQGLVNVGVDTINSFIFFANDQLAFWLPPLPPIPPHRPVRRGGNGRADRADRIDGDDVGGRRRRRGSSVEETRRTRCTETAGDVVEGEEAADRNRGRRRRCHRGRNATDRNRGNRGRGDVDEEEDSRSRKSRPLKMRQQRRRKSPPHPHPEPSRLRARSATPGSTPHPTRRPTTPRTARRTTTTPDETTEPTDAAPVRERRQRARRRPTTTPARSKSARRIQVAPQHQGGWQRAETR